MGALGAAFVEYLIKLIMFTAVAALGIAVGIKLRKNKNAKDEMENAEQAK